MDRLSMVLDATGALTSFASVYTQSHPVKQDFEVTPAVLDQLQVFLSERNIRPGVGDRSSHSQWIQSRLKQEILTLAVWGGEGRRDGDAARSGDAACVEESGERTAVSWSI
jgi:hypothetical protein